MLVDGWIQSGDKGTIDENGFVRVVGRVKDSFKTSKGKYVTPNPLEEAILTNDYIEQACVAGNGIPQPIALINLSEIGAAADTAEVERSVWQTVDELNQRRAQHERISTVIIHRAPWSVENDLLTPTLKVRRGMIDERFGEEFPDWYSSKENVIWS